ncbi:MAG: hypothetical protein IPN18_18005 [Ignavibacteriales bacterium]|nr:hypothetical protein [Ignavibacteriales bacterium]
MYERFAGQINFPDLFPSWKGDWSRWQNSEKRTDTGKYINSPESPIYNKSKVLYGLSPFQR